jgi:hypothetical protein
MATQCHNQLTLGFQPKIVLDFNGGQDHQLLGAFAVAPVRQATGAYQEASRPT